MFLTVFSVLAPISVSANHRTIDDREADFNFRYSRNIRRSLEKLDDDPVEELRIPVLLDIGPNQIYDSWGDPRGEDGERGHEGNDILAPRGSFVVSPTEAIVASIGYGDSGGNYVYTFNPGGERYYYAHLDSIAEELDVGDELEPGDLLGYVGTTGNANGGVPHLHFGIYRRGPLNPYPRLTEEFSLEERMDALIKIVDDDDDPEALARKLVQTHRGLFKEAMAEDIDIPEEVATIFAGERLIASLFKRDLDIGATGVDVLLLQTLLNNKGFVVAATGAGSPGNETQYYGPATQAAVARFQQAYGIEPAVGYFGLLTRTKLAEL